MILITPATATRVIDRVREAVKEDRMMTVQGKWQGTVHNLDYQPEAYEDGLDPTVWPARLIEDAGTLYVEVVVNGVDERSGWKRTRKFRDFDPPLPRSLRERLIAQGFSL